MSLENLINQRTEQVGNNTIEYRFDGHLARILSFFGSIPARALLLSTDIGNYPRQETQQHIRDALQQSGLENTLVRVGHTAPFTDVYRLFTDERLKSASFLGKVFLGIPHVIVGGLLGKLYRADHYNPFTRTVHVYSDVPAIARHELGHAEDFQQRTYLSLYAFARAFPPVMLWQEGRASYLAHRHTPVLDRGGTGRYLVPAFASYVAAFAVGSAFSITALPIIAGAHLLGNTYRGLRALGNYFTTAFTRPHQEQVSAPHAPAPAAH